MAKTQVRGRQLYVNDITGADLVTPIGVFDETKAYSEFDTVLWNGSKYQVKPGNTITASEEGDLSQSPSSSPDKWILADNIRWYHNTISGSDVATNGSQYFLKLDFFYYTPTGSTGLNEFTFVFVYRNGVLLTPVTDYKRPGVNYAGTVANIRDTIQILTGVNASDTFDVYYYEYTQDFTPSILVGRDDGEVPTYTKCSQRYHFDNGSDLWNGYLDSVTAVNGVSHAYTLRYRSYDNNHYHDINKRFPYIAYVSDIGGFNINLNSGWAIEFWKWGKHRKNKSLKKKGRLVPKKFTGDSHIYLNEISIYRGRWKARLRHVQKNIVTNFTEADVIYKRCCVYRKGNTRDQHLATIEFLQIT